MITKSSLTELTNPDHIEILNEVLKNEYVCKYVDNIRVIDNELYFSVLDEYLKHDKLIKGLENKKPWIVEEDRLKKLRDKTSVDGNTTYSLCSDEKFKCPSCGADGKFVRFKSKSGVWLDGDYGWCDREIECGFYEKPPIVEKATVVKKPTGNKNLFNCDILDSKKYDKFYVNNPGNLPNQFLRCIAKEFDTKIALEVQKSFSVGTFWDGGTIYPFYFDGGLMSAQVVWYGSDFHRSKEERHHATWLHKFKYVDDNGHEHTSNDRLSIHFVGQWDSTLFELGLPFFNWKAVEKDQENKSICIVEAPKTAIIMSIVMPEYIWIAAGSLQGMQTYKFENIGLFKHFYLFPDMSTGDKAKTSWEKNCKYVLNHHFKTIDYYPKELGDTQRIEDAKNGKDVADFIIGNPLRDSYVGEIRAKLKSAEMFM